MKTHQRVIAVLTAVSLTLAGATLAFAQLSQEDKNYIDATALKIADSSGLAGANQANAMQELGLGAKNPLRAELDKRVIVALKVRPAVFKALDESKGAKPDQTHMDAALTFADIPKTDAFVDVVKKRADAGAQLISDGIAFRTAAFDRAYENEIAQSAQLTKAASSDTPLISPYDTPSARYEKSRAAFLKSEEEREKRDRGENANHSLIRDADKLPFVSNVGVYVHAGVKLLSPYKLEAVDDPRPGNAGKQTALLKPDGDAAIPFFEIVYANNWAWRDSRIKDTVAKKWNGWVWREKIKSGSDPIDRLINVFLPMSDAEIRLGYNGVSQKDDTKAIIGTGRLNLSARFSPIIYCEESEGFAHSYTADIGIGLITDANSYKTVRSAYYGLGYTLQNLTFIHTRRPVLVRCQFGFLDTEVPDIDDNRYVNRPILEPDATGAQKFVAPRYKSRSGLSFNVEMMIPVSESLFVTLGGNVNRTKLNSWTTYIGLTTNLQGIFESLTK